MSEEIIVLIVAWLLCSIRFALWLCGSESRRSYEKEIGYSWKTQHWAFFLSWSLIGWPIGLIFEIAGTIKEGDGS